VYTYSKAVLIEIIFLDQITKNGNKSLGQ